MNNQEILERLEKLKNVISLWVENVRLNEVMIQSTERVMDDINQQIGPIDEAYVSLRYGINDSGT